MSLNLAKNITKRSWDTIPIPDTVIARIKEIFCNKPNKFIFTDRRGIPIGDIEIKGLDRDDDDSNRKQSPQDPHHKFQAIEDTDY